MKRKIPKRFISFTLTVIMMFCLILPSITLTVNADNEESYIVDCIRNYEVVDNDFAYYTVNIHVEIPSSVNRPNYLQLYVYEYTNNVKGKRIIDGAMTYPWETGINLDLSMNVAASKNNTNGMYLFELGYTLGKTTGSDFTLLCEKAVYLSFNDTIISVSNITLNKNATSIMVGNTEKLTATVNPFNAPNQNIKWSSSNTSIATVDSNGKITAVSPGTTIVTVTTVDGGKTAICNVTVINTNQEDNIPADAIHIKTAEQLASIGGSQSAGKYYVLDNEINLVNEWVPINDFRGTLDGRGYSINNLYILENSRRKYVGLLSEVTKNVKIMDLTVNIGIEGITSYPSWSENDSFSGGIISYIGSGCNVILGNCYVNGNIYAKTEDHSSTRSVAGGLLGYISSNTVIDIENCYNKANVSAYSRFSTSSSGGLIGTSRGKIINIRSSYNSGNITSDSRGGTDSYSGGLIGEINSTNIDIYINESYNLGKINSTINSSDFNGATSTSGGIIGDVYNSLSNIIIINCFSTGDSTAFTYLNNGAFNIALSIAGGIFGCINNTTSIKIHNSYSSGNISAVSQGGNMRNSHMGGIGGFLSYGSINILNCYYTNNISRAFSNIINNLTNVKALTDSEMRNQSSFIGFDFVTVWTIDMNVNNGYPYLRNGNGNTDTSEKDVKIFFRINDWIKNGINEVGSVTLPWKDSYFEQGSYTYNHELARIACALSASAYISNDGTKDGRKEGKHLLASLGSLGFEHRVFGNYAKTVDGKDLESVYNTKVISDIEHIEPGTVYEQDPHTVGYSFSYKPITINNETFNLISIVVRGTALEEWESNFSIWKDGNSPEDIYHYGFKIATDRMAKSFEKYINDNGLTDKFKNKIFITGHSRGAAIANLFAAQITDSGKYAYSSDIYAYTFATPNGTKDVKAKDTQNYRNIFNIINAEDFVPYFMLSDENWGYWKYGRTFVFPSENVDKNYHSKYENLMNENFINITGGNFNKYENGYNGYGSVQKFIDDVKKVAPTVYDFYNTSYELKYIPDDPFSIYLTPKEYFDKLLEHLRFGNQSMYFLSMSTAPFFGAISRFFVGNEAGIPFIGKNLTYSHTAETYVSWMLTVENQIDITTTLKKVTVACPVNVMIYDKDNNLIGEIINNNIELSNEDIGLYVDDDIKTIYLPENEVYHFEFTGTDIGLMNYTVSSIDFITSKEIETKHFSQVSLYNGKEMISTIDMVSDTKLFVKKNGEIIKEILQDGTEILLVQLPQITNIMANQTYLNSMGGEIKILINGENLIGQDIKVYLNGEENTVAEIIDDTTAIATAIIPINLTIHDETHIISVYLNGKDIEEYIYIIVAKPDQETGITILQENVIAGNGQGNVNFNIKSANGKGYSIYLSENGEDYKIYTDVNYNSKGAHIRGLKNEKTYYIKIAYTDNGVTIMSNAVVLIPLK